MGISTQRRSGQVVLRGPGGGRHAWKAQAHDFSNGVRNRYADRFRDRSIAVVLDLDLADRSPTARASRTRFARWVSLRSGDSQAWRLARRLASRIH
jgi:hypothetical protein